MSHSFKDSLGREWTVAVNVSTVTAVERATGLSLLTILDDKAQPLADLLGNLPLLATVVYWCCKRQADQKNIDDYGFGEGLGGDSLESMRNAFLEALTDFFPDARRRAILTKLVESAKKTEAAMMAKVDQAISEIDTDKLAQDALTVITSNLSGKQPEALVSTPAS